MDCDGDPLQAADRQRFRPIAYRLDKATDVAKFVKQADDLEQAQRALWKRKQYVLIDSATGKDKKTVTFDDLSPGWQNYPVKARRLFDDWAASSAGASGARLCEHWVMSMTDYTSVKGVLVLELIPSWTTRQKLAEVDASKGDCYTFFGKLQTLDRRVKVPFGWYFFMLHGNRVSNEAGERVLRDAEAGLIVLPEIDYRVLKGWKAHLYGF